ncbi:MAG TPA: heme-binding protein [Rhodocyclaceae bacterium]|nr:heme-binding protein [Rhodocyclaceae bacterium]
MYLKPTLSLDDVELLLSTAKSHAQEKGWRVSLAVSDDGGHLLGSLRLDGASPFTMEMAAAKARTAALGRKESRIYEEVINKGRSSFLSAPLLQGMVEGGVNIVIDGHSIGAVGVSGVQSFEDAEVAQAAIAALLNND